jgi:hypothetical protein
LSSESFGFIQIYLHVPTKNVCKIAFSERPYCQGPSLLPGCQGASSLPVDVLVASGCPRSQSSALVQRDEGIFAFNNQLLPNAAIIKVGFAKYCSKCHALLADSVKGTSTRSARRSFACRTPSSERHEMVLLSSDFVPLGREKFDSTHAVVGWTGANTRRTQTARVELANSLP